MSDHFQVIRSIAASSDFMCYVNNSMGSVRKIFHVVVEYAPHFIDNEKHEQQHSVKMHHGVNFHCRVDGSPEPQVKWIFVSSLSLLLSSLIKFPFFTELI